MSADLTSFDFGLKEYYTSEKVESLMFSSRPFMARVAKSTEFVGDVMPVPVVHGAPQGVAGSLANAQTAAGDSTGGQTLGKRFNVTTGDLHGVVEIADKLIKASRNNKGAFFEAKTEEIDNLYEQVADVLSQALWVGNGGIPIGRRASISTNTVTLSSASDVFNFEVGMTVVASSATGEGGSDALRSGSTTVASVDRTAGTVTLTSAAGITSFADNDYLFRLGTFAGNTGISIFQGVGAFVYSSDSPPTLYGMTRTSDAQRLAGCRIASADLTGLSIGSRIELLGTRMAGRYKVPLGGLVGYLNPEDWTRLSIEMRAKGVQPMNDASAKLGFMKLSVVAGGNTIDCYADPFVPQGTVFVLKESSWKLWSMGELCAPVNGDGLTMLRKATTNNYEYRLIGYPALVTRAPGWNGRVTV